MVNHVFFWGGSIRESIMFDMVTFSVIYVQFISLSNLGAVWSYLESPNILLHGYSPIKLLGIWYFNVDNYMESPNQRRMRNLIGMEYHVFACFSTSQMEYYIKWITISYQYIYIYILCIYNTCIYIYTYIYIYIHHLLQFLENHLPIGKKTIELKHWNPISPLSRGPPGIPPGFAPQIPGSFRERPAWRCASPKPVLGCGCCWSRHGENRGVKTVATKPWCARFFGEKHILWWSI